MAPRETSHAHVFLAVDILIGVAAYVAMFYRRRWPLAVALAINAATLISGLAAGPAVLTAVSLATRRVYWQVVLVGVVGAAAGFGYLYVEPGRGGGPNWWVPLGFGIAVTIAMMAVGMYIGSRRELVFTLRERARQAEAQQELRVESARAAERERIAREMHDVLAHRISMVSMHAGALAFRQDLPAEQVRETAALIQTSAHQALTDLREVLGVLREDAEVRGDRPQPTLGDLPGLVAEARANGMCVDLAVEVDPTVPVPDQAGRTVYRVVQEGLTNARKHAAGVRVEVSVVGTAGDGVEVWVRNRRGFGQTPLAPGSGLGLVGLRERAELAGGRLDVDDDREGFALHVWLPWPAAA
ncbi:histidine kinase [Nocardioides mangrovicus]|uniref:histidine kinase n=2 Tax=Nocardioides mangrovicus TaxID=2478913 RepID=A0A3L8P5Z2_9ACTN|nr:histidine kinase [Nocardioides mangrovicus]